MTRKITKTCSRSACALFIATLTIPIASFVQAQQADESHPSVEPLPVRTTKAPRFFASAQPIETADDRSRWAAESQARKSASLAPNSILFYPVVLYGSGGSGATSVAIADVNGDGKPDVVVANCIASDGYTCGAEGTVGVLLGNGNGTFQPVVTYDSGGVGATSIAIADVDGDGRPDLIVANCGPSPSGPGSCQGPYQLDGIVSVLLGNGDGTFQPAVSYDSGGLGPNGVVIADVNGDGELDIVVGGSENSSGAGDVGVLLGNGDGTFQPVVAYGPGFRGVTSVAVADMNGDGNQDIAIAYACTSGNCQHGTVGVLLGNGDGTFRPELTYPSGGSFSYSIAAGDVNEDGKPDLLVANFCGGTCSSGSGEGSVGVLLGNGDGTFRAATAYDSGGAGALSVAVADVNGDRKPDLLVANDNSGTVGVLLGNGDGTFQSTVAYDSGWPGSDSVTVADLNGDGKPDIVAGGRDPGSVGILVNSTTKSAPATKLVSSRNPSIYGQKVTWTATVTTSGAVTPTGKVKFTWGIYTLGTATLNSSGDATLTRSNLNADTYPVTAVYLGDANNLSSTSPVINQVVTEATSSTTLTSSPNPSASGQAVTFTATITSPTVKPTGPVTFSVGKTVLGTAQLSSGKATFTTSTLAAGSTTITATYSGDSNIAASSASVTQTVQP